MENINKESIFINIRVQNDLIYLFSDMYTKKDLKKEITKNLILIFKLNNFVVSESTINKYFSNMINFIIENLKDNTIKSSNDLKFYIENELNLIIENDMYLFNRFFNNEYKTIENYLFMEIE